jgi:hypothetical protein
MGRITTCPPTKRVLTLTFLTVALGLLAWAGLATTGEEPGATRATGVPDVVRAASLSPAGRSKRLTWAPPKLDHPVAIVASADKHTLKLNDSRDYVVRMPSRALQTAGGLVIVGGHNVVLIGGHISIPWQGPSPQGQSRRGLFLKDQTGTVHIEGLWISGRDLAEGIDLDQRRGATVQLENIRVDRVRPRDQVRFSDWHSDLLQTWGGPARLRIDKFTGISTYQGLFLVPHFFAMGSVDLRRVELIGVNRGRYLLWLDGQHGRVTTHEVYVRTRRHPVADSVWPNRKAWPDVHGGRPRGGSFVPSGSVGARYRRPGYLVTSR